MHCEILTNMPYVSTDPDTNYLLLQAEQRGGDVLAQLEMKRTWESGNHPYLFFNEDGETFSPLGFFVENRGEILKP